MLFMGNHCKYKQVIMLLLKKFLQKMSVRLVMFDLRCVSRSLNCGFYGRYLTFTGQSMKGLW